MTQLQTTSLYIWDMFAICSGNMRQQGTTTRRDGVMQKTGSLKYIADSSGAVKSGST